jgi:hypothetical protein
MAEIVQPIIQSKNILNSAGEKIAINLKRKKLVQYRTTSETSTFL